MNLNFFPKLLKFLFLIWLFFRRRNDYFFTIFINLSTPSTHHVAHNKTVLYEIIKALAIFLMFDMHLCLWWYIWIFLPQSAAFHFIKAEHHYTIYIQYTICKKQKACFYVKKGFVFLLKHFIFETSWLGRKQNQMFFCIFLNNEKGQLIQRLIGGVRSRERFLNLPPHPPINFVHLFFLI